MIVTRRHALKSIGLGAATLALTPTRLFAHLPAESSAAGFLWINKHQNLSTRVWRHFDVWNRDVNGARMSGEPWRAGFERLRAILDEAEYKAKSVRAVGARWSLSPVAVSQDIMINTTPLNVHQIGLSQEFVSSSAVDPSHLVWAQCGTSVMELSASLEARGLSLPTSGASNGQTICGAIATGTHGSALRVGSMQDYMLGLHVMTDAGRHYWIERASNPIVSDEFCAQFGATLVRDDRLFRAAVVGLGSFGVIHAVLFHAVPIYLLEVHRRLCDWHGIATAACLLDTDAIDLPYPGEEPFHFDVLVNPYCVKPGKRCAVVTAMYKRPFQAVAVRRRDDSKLVPGTDLLGLAGAIARLAPHSVPQTVERIFNGMLKATDRAPRGTHGQVFGPTELVGKSLSMEVGVNLADTPAALETLVETAKAHEYPGVVHLRFVRGSDALLAFTRHEMTCTIEMTGAGSTRTTEFYDYAWSALEARRIPFTLHWGKVNNTTAGNIRARFGANVDDWIAARESFLSPVARKMFGSPALSSYLAV